MITYILAYYSIPWIPSLPTLHFPNENGLQKQRANKDFFRHTKPERIHYHQIGTKKKCYLHNEMLYNKHTHKKTVIACINSAQSHKHSYEFKKASHKWTCAAGSIYMKT